jgi:hypothetical protein
MPLAIILYFLFRTELCTEMTDIQVYLFSCLKASFGIPEQNKLPKIHLDTFLVPRTYSGSRDWVRWTGWWMVPDNTPMKKPSQVRQMNSGLSLSPVFYLYHNILIYWWRYWTDKNKWNNIPSSCIRRNNIVKMSILPILVCFLLLQKNTWDWVIKKE